MHVNTTPVTKNMTGLFGTLTRAGYATGIFGKVTNDQSNVLKLMSDANSATYIDSPLDYNNFEGLTYWRKFRNGTFFTEKLDAKEPVFGTTYQTTQIGNRTLRWLDDVLARDDEPFFAYIGPCVWPSAGLSGACAA